MLLCSNCHKGITSNEYSSDIVKTYKSIKKEEIYDLVGLYQKKREENSKKKICICGGTKTKEALYCKKCAKPYIRPTKIDWPSIKELLEDLQTMSFNALARKLDVSNNAVRKHLKKHNIDPKTLEPYQ